MSNHTEVKIRSLINGDTVQIGDEEIDYIKKRLREIKKNCTIVLSQLKNER